MPAKQTMRLYFDHNATTPVAPEVLEAMLPYLREEYGNASSIHRFGQSARAAVERARGQLAALLNADSTEIIFTGGGTEADNMAVLGAVSASTKQQKHVITSAFEHPAVLLSCKALEKEGVAVTYLRPSAEGFIDAEEVRRALRPETVLITIMHANNEVGTVQPIAEIAEIARAAGVRLHTDAVQSTGKIPIDVKKLGIDLYSLSAHKLYGPKGIGALYIRKGVSINPVMFGGHGEHDPRPGTENVPGIVGLGAAAQLAGEILRTEMVRLAELRDRLESTVIARLDAVQVNGVRGGIRDGRFLRVPNTTNLHFDYVEGESLVIALDLKGVACSLGAACASGTVNPSHVLLAIGLSAQRASGSLRISLGRQNTAADVDALIEALVSVVERLRALSPQTPAGVR
jgi:cysteine desulfurase